jgi:regulation of enolase protein 1 (concanavalin A-like superfamily)
VPDARCVEFDAKYSKSDIFPVCRYPHSVEAKVVAVTDCESDWRLSKLNKGSVVQHIKLAKTQQEIRIASAEDALDGLRKKCGVDIDNCNLFLEVCPHNLPSSFSGSSGFMKSITPEPQLPWICGRYLIMSF